MDTWERIERTGFYPRVVARALARALAGDEPLASVCQVDAAFDRGSVFRHLTVAVLTERSLIHVHVDELDGGGAGLASSVHPIGRIGAVSTMEVLDDPEADGSVSELTIAIDLGGQRRTEVEPAQCDDPECPADHGYTASSFPDDLTLRVSAAADGPDLLAEAERFVDELRRVMGGARA
ncbi:DUF5998 family protein [Actinomyces sp. B33]|uniref:DUF5998 family protein n=1 Tax=Actinomyces sp. B33 TaxID=2942131 RepID=UPI00233FBA97|nr:DUF5998 family protein [Actinomyces sp. B33]MDC4233184.1 DUF5998 family protein [Actinomyces sp. B33]